MKNLTLKQLDTLDRLSKIIAEANGDWNYTPGDAYYYPVFNFDNVFSFNYVNSWRSALSIPAPLVFKTEELCEQVVKENLELYKLVYLPDSSYKRGDKVIIKRETHELLAYEDGTYIAKSNIGLVYVNEKDSAETKTITKQQAIEELEKVLNCKVEIL